VVASLGAAYMSTIDTQLNWGSSYLVNDFYKRFIRKEALDKHYVLVARLITVVLMASAAVVSFWIQDALSAFNLILTIGAGTGLIFLLRWFWYRINAWTEISAMLAATLASLVVEKGFPAWGVELESYKRYLVVFGVTTLTWVVVTFLTRPSERRTLESFYRLIRPAGPGWNSVRKALGPLPASDSIAWNMVGVLLGIVMLYSALFGIGSFCYLRPVPGAFLCSVALACLFFIVRLRQHLGFGGQKNG
jgi:Na+/proline symporter